MSVPKQKTAFVGSLRQPAVRDHRGAVVDEFGHRAVRADGIARKDEKSVVVLTEEAFEKLVLLTQLPFLRAPDSRPPPG